MGGEENQLNNKITRVVNVEARKPRILYIEGEPRVGVQVHPARHGGLPRYRHRTAEHAAHHAEQDLPAGHQGLRKELEDGFPAKPEELFAYQGLIIGSVEASYFTRAAAAGDSRFRGPARRRPAVHRRARLA